MLKIEDILKMQDILKNFEQHENTITPSYAQELVKLAQIIQSKISY